MIALLGVLAWFLMAAMTCAADEPTVIAQVSVQPLQIQSLTPAIAAYGQVIADPTHTQSITTQTGGQVSRVLVEAGQRVKKGQPLLVMQTDPNANLAFQQAQSQQVVMNQDLTQKQYLFARQMATHQDVVRAKQAVLDADQRIKTLEKIGSNQPVQTIKATEDALVMTVPAAVGSIVAPGGALLTLSAQQALLLRFGIEPEDAAVIVPGTRIRFHSVFAAHGQQTAIVLRVDGQINPATRLLDVIAKPDDQNSPLITGTTLQGDIDLPAQRGLLVPTDAVLMDSGTPTVFRIESASRGANEKIARAIPVHVVLRVGESSVIEPQVSGALGVGDQIVTQGQYVLQDGMAVRIQPTVSTIQAPKP
ncbi:MAG: efflux RND transporter periplasmic adaptor subunit [Halothiobacillus sp.]